MTQRAENTRFREGELPAGARVDDEGHVILEEREEHVVVGAEAVETGRVTIRKRVDAVEETVDAELATHGVRVERREVGEIVDPKNPPKPRQEGDVTILPVLEEVLVVSRRLMLKEEVYITRETQTRHEAVPVTRRVERVEVDRDA